MFGFHGQLNNVTRLMGGTGGKYKRWDPHCTKNAVGKLSVLVTTQFARGWGCKSLESPRKRDAGNIYQRTVFHINTHVHQYTSDSLKLRHFNTEMGHKVTPSGLGLVGFGVFFVVLFGLVWFLGFEPLHTNSYHSGKILQVGGQINC